MQRHARRTRRRRGASARWRRPQRLEIRPTTRQSDPGARRHWHACSGTLWQPGDAVVVKVDYVYHMIWPLAFGNRIPMASTVRMRIE